MKFPLSVSIMLGNAETSHVKVNSLQELAELVRMHDWAPGIFQGNHRLAANFISCEVIGLDVDNGLSLEQAKEMFKDYAHIIVPSKSHQVEKHGVIADRFRIILFPETQIDSRDQYCATWASLFAKFPFIDKSAKDCSRMFFKCPHPIASSNELGKLVPVEAIPQKTIGPTPASSEAPRPRGKLAHSTLLFMLEGAPSGSWNISLFKAAKDYQQNGRSIDEFTEDARQITGKLDTSDLRSIESAFKNEPIHEARTDYDDGLRKLILSCNLIINQEDSKDTFLVDVRNGETRKIDMLNLRSVLQSDADFYMKSKKVIASIVYEPHQHRVLWPDDVGLYFYNSYRPPAWKKDVFFGGKVSRVSEIPEIYEKFFLHLTDNDKPSYEYLLNWLALSLQDRNLTILTAIGEEGIGKGILGEIMEDLHGLNNFVKVRDTVFKEKFNAPFENKTLVYVDEIKITKREALDRIKDVVNWQIEIEKKGEDPKSIKNHASFYLSSNSFDAIPLEPGQRRFSIIQLTDTKLKDSEISRTWSTLQKLVDELRSPKNIGLLASYLCHREIDRKKMLETFVSERAREVREAGLKEWESWVVQDWCAVRAGLNKTYSINELLSAIKMKYPHLDRIGRRPIEDLAKRFPEILRVKRKDVDGRATREIEVCGPQSPKEQKPPSQSEQEFLDEADELLK